MGDVGERWGGRQAAAGAVRRGLWLQALVVFVSGGCLAERPGGEVGSETHFLRACVANDACGDGLSCLCGVCTTTCEGACAEGACAPGDSPAVASHCGAALATGLCLEPCGASGCDAGVCRGGFCVGARPEGAACVVAEDCAQGQCTLGFCGPACMLPEADCAAATFCMVPGAAAGVCLPGVIEAFPAALVAGQIALGQSRVMQVTLANRSPRPQTIVAVQIETRDLTPPTEIAVVSAPEVLAVDGLGTIELALTPSRQGARAYRLVVRVEETAPALVVPVDFVGR